jgi:SAM-dependent methyltransferase
MSVTANKSFYDRHWRDGWKARFMYDPISKRDIARFLLKKTGFEDGCRRVVDIGFGFGLILFSLSKDDHIHGVELSESAIEFARAQAARMGYRKADFQCYNGEGPLHLPSSSFDLVICSHVLEHVPDDRMLLGQIRRILKDDGVGLLLVPINEEHFPDPRHVRKYSIESFLSLLEGENLTPISTYTGDHLWSLFGWYFEKDLHNRIPIFGFVVSSFINVLASSIPFVVVRWMEGSLLRSLSPRQFAVCVKRTK